MNPDWSIELQIKSLTRQAQAQAREIIDLQQRCEYYEQLLLQLIISLQKAEVIVPIVEGPPDG
jgi:hypothetical protein